MEWLTTQCGKYRIESLSAATFPGALKVIREDFFTDEAVCIGTEVNKNPEAAEELLELCADAALDGVSLVAVAIDSGEVAAVAFNKIQVPPTDVSEKSFFEIFAAERCKQGSSRSLIQFMSNIDARCNLFEKYGADCSLEIMFLATVRKHRNNKLATLLCEVSLDLAKKLKEGPVQVFTVEDLGPKYSNMTPRDPNKLFPKICQIIGTGIGTQKIIKNLGFTTEITVPFDEFVHNGKTYAERLLGGPRVCELAAKALE